MRTLTRPLALLAASALSLSAAQAQDTGALVVSGTVEETFGEDGFVIDFGDGTVAVATGQIYDDNPDFRLTQGERVTVYAAPTEEFFADRIVDAGAVYVAGRDTFASTAERPRRAFFFGRRRGVDEPATVGVQGEVTGVRGRLMQVDAGGQTVTVDTRSMRYDPLDEVGRQRVREGDVVIVTGALADALFRDQELIADRVTSLTSARPERAAREQAVAQRRDEREAQETSRPEGGEANGQPERPAERAAEREADQQADRAAGGDQRSQAQRQASGPVPAPSAGPAEAEDMGEFETYDRNGDGAVTVDEYVRVAARPANVTRREATRLFEVLSRGDRLMTKREFLNPPARYERLSERFLSN